MHRNGPQPQVFSEIEEGACMMWEVLDEPPVEVNKPKEGLYFLLVVWGGPFCHSHNFYRVHDIWTIIISSHIEMLQQTEHRDCCNKCKKVKLYLLIVLFEKVATEHLLDTDLEDITCCNISTVYLRTLQQNISDRYGFGGNYRNYMLQQI